MPTKNLADVATCTRCKKPMFRERLPIVTLVETYKAKKGHLQEAVNAAQAGVLLGLGVVTFAIMPTDVEFEPGNDHIALCLRCSIALRAFLEGLSEEELSFEKDLEESRQLLERK